LYEFSTKLLEVVEEAPIILSTPTLKRYADVTRGRAWARHYSFIKTVYYERRTTTASRKE